MGSVLKVAFSVCLFLAAVPCYSFQVRKLESGNRISFDKSTEGIMRAHLLVPDSVDFFINILSVESDREETVFSFPLISGSKYYPLEVKPGEHNLEIRYDLRFNFCKVYIDGQWLTSVLSGKQHHFINVLSTGM
jgi:hypothetical protein